MKKIHLLIILFFISSQTHAAWTKVWQSDSSQYFIQSNTVKYKSQLVNLWLLTNNNIPDESGYLSYKQKIEMDCGYSQLRLVSQIGYAEKMGSGRSNRFRKSYEEWIEILPDSLGGELYRYFCLKK